MLAGRASIRMTGKMVSRFLRRSSLATGLWLLAAAFGTGGVAAQSVAALTHSDIFPAGRPDGFASLFCAEPAQVPSVADGLYPSSPLATTAAPRGKEAKHAGPLSLLPRWRPNQ